MRHTVAVPWAAQRSSTDDFVPSGGLKVLHVAESAFGGVGSYLNQILPILRGNHRLILPESDKFMIPDFTVDYVRAYVRNGRSISSLWNLVSASWSQVAAWRPDVVHLHSSFAGVLLRPLLVVTRVFYKAPRQVVYSPHGWGFDITGSRLRKGVIVAIERALATITDRVIVLSKRELDGCIELGFPSAKLVHIYNGIRKTSPQPTDAIWKDDRLKVLFIGRFDRQKGMDVLFDAVECHADKIVVWCAGASVVDRFLPRSVPSNVELLGWKSEAEISGLLESADVVVIPSRWEGFGLVAIEAMRGCRAVVAARVGGLPEVVEDGVTGRLVPPEDSAALAAALLQDGPEQRNVMGLAGRARFEALFLNERSAEQLYAIYSSDNTSNGRYMSTCNPKKSI